MKNNNYLFIIILIVIFYILYYCFFNQIIENLESAEESSETAQKQLNLQQIIDKFSGTLRQQMKNLIFSKTSESKNEIDNVLQQNTELNQTIEKEVTPQIMGMIKKVEHLVKVVE